MKCGIKQIASRFSFEREQVHIRRIRNTNPFRRGFSMSSLNYNSPTGLSEVHNSCGIDMSFGHEMRDTGFEPVKALSQRILSPSRLTAPATPHLFVFRFLSERDRSFGCISRRTNENHEVIRFPATPLVNQLEKNFVVLNVCLFDECYLILSGNFLFLFFSAELTFELSLSSRPRRSVSSL